MTTEKKTKRMSGWRGIAITVLVILFFLGIIMTYYVMLYSETREKIIKNGELNALTSAEKIDKYLARGVDTMQLACYTLDNMLLAEKTQEEIRDFLVRQSSALMKITENNTTGLYGYINGEYLDGTDWVPDDDYVPTERPWYIVARANVGRTAVANPYVDAQTNTVTITFCQTLCDVKSVAAMDFSVDFLQTVAEEITEAEESSVEIILNRNYHVIAHSDKSEVGKNYLAENGTLGKALVDKLRTSGENFFSFKYDGSEYIAYSASVSNDWICVSLSDATSAFSQLRQALLFTVIAIVLIVSVVLVIMIRSNRKNAQFSRLSMNVVESLAAAIDAKDTYTNGHSGRVAEYSREISRRYGYSEKKQEEIFMMGLLHDVGKIGIPDAVINKPGKLTPEEYEIIKTHPATGAHILSKTTEIPRMALGAHWHHERYDGKGYPDGLSGDGIPEEARIIAVADSYDAMTSRRSYRDMLPQEVVREEIEKGKGTQFDPKFADIMLKMIDEDKDYTQHGQ